MSSNTVRRSWTPPRLAREWSVDVSKVLSFIHSGELPAINIARAANGRPRFLILPEHLEAFKRRRAAAPVPAQNLR